MLDILMATATLIAIISIFFLCYLTHTLNQQLKNNTILTIGGSAQECVIKGRMVINKMPTSNLTITFNVDNILTSNPT